MTGKQYIGYSRNKKGKVFHDRPREERTMGERCRSKVCKKSKVRFCDTVSDTQRLKIFGNFWSTMNWDQRKVYIANMVEQSKVKRRSKGCKEVNNNEEKSDIDETDEENNDTGECKNKRNNALSYYLVIDDKRLQVCQKMFLHTLGIKKWTVRYWICGDKNQNNTSVEDHTSSGIRHHIVLLYDHHKCVWLRKQEGQIF